MKTGQRPRGETPQAGDYAWLESYRRPRGAGPSPPEDEDEETLSIAVESDLLRTAFFTILLGALAGLLAYCGFGIVEGAGRSIFKATATLSALLACGAVASRYRRWLRFVLALGSLCTFALLVDQLVYSHWHRKVDRLATRLQQSIESGRPIGSDLLELRPTSFWIDPDQEILLRFEPPALAWTYRLDSVSPLGHTLVSGWHRVLSRLTRGRDLDRVARALVRPHQACSVAVKSSERPLACQEGEGGPWTLSIDTRPGRRAL